VGVAVKIWRETVEGLLAVKVDLVSTVEKLVWVAKTSDQLGDVLADELVDRAMREEAPWPERVRARYLRQLDTRRWLGPGGKWLMLEKREVFEPAVWMRVCYLAPDDCPRGWDGIVEEVPIIRRPERARVLLRRLAVALFPEGGAPTSPPA
jgi:hypothetical protein